jgi:hypothetical protein
MRDALLERGVACGLGPPVRRGFVLWSSTNSARTQHRESSGRLCVRQRSIPMSPSGPTQTSESVTVRSASPPCVDGSELARAFFTFAGLVGAPMCSAC